MNTTPNTNTKKPVAIFTAKDVDTEMVNHAMGASRAEDDTEFASHCKRAELLGKMSVRMCGTFRAHLRACQVLGIKPKKDYTRTYGV